MVVYQNINEICSGKDHFCFETEYYYFHYNKGDAGEVGLDCYFYPNVFEGLGCPLFKQKLKDDRYFVL